MADVAHGALALSADGSFVYTPASDYSGSDLFSYQASDGGLSSPMTTVTLTVNAQPDAPAAAVDAYSVNEDDQLIVPVATGVLANDSDADGDALTAVLVGDVTHGTLVLSADGSFVYTPAADYSGSDLFSYQASDGGLSSPVTTATLTVQAQPDAPVAVADAYSVNEDDQLSVPMTTGVLANDSDADGDALTAVLVADVTHGTLALSADGSFVYTPAPDYSGSDQFSYRASDGGLSSPVTMITLTVQAQPDAPVAVADAYSVNEDDQLTVPVTTGVLANDSDADADVLTAALVTDVAHGTLALSADGSFVYTPAPDYSGSDQFSYQASDGGLSSPVTTVTLTVNAQPDAPEAGPEAYSVSEDDQLTVPVTTGVLANDSDADADVLTAALVTDVAHGTLALSADGSFVYTPAPDYSGSDQFSYRASDGGLSSPVTTVTLTVNAQPDAPVAVAEAYSVSEDDQLIVPMPTGVLANDSDADADVLTAALVTDVAHGTLALSADGSFVYTPAPDYSGSDQFSYQASDGGLSSPVTTVTLTVNAQPDAPVAVAEAYSVSEDDQLIVPMPTGVLANDSDTDGDSLTAVLVTDVAHGTLALSTDGSFVYTPAPDYSGSDQFSYRASDGGLSSPVTTVTLTVQDVLDRTDPISTSTLAADLGILADRLEVNSTLDDPSQANDLQFSLNEDSLVRVEVIAERLGSSLDCVLELYDSFGTPLASADDTNGLDPIIRQSLPAGQYIVRVTAFGRTSGQYRLALQQIDSDQTLSETTTSLPIPGTRSPDDGVYPTVISSTATINQSRGGTPNGIQFVVELSEELDEERVLDWSNYRLFASGGDRVFFDANELDRSDAITAIAYDAGDLLADRPPRLTVLVATTINDEYQLVLRGEGITDLDGHPLLGGDYRISCYYDTLAPRIEYAFLASYDLNQAPDRAFIQWQDRFGLRDSRGNLLRDGDQAIRFQIPQPGGTAEPLEQVALDAGSNPAGPALLSATLVAEKQAQLLLTFDRALDTQEALRESNYLLVEAGPNGVLGDTDDVVYPIAAGSITYHPQAKEISLRLDGLAPGKYELRVDGTTDHDLDQATVLDSSNYQLERIGADGSILARLPITSVYVSAANDRLVLSGFGTLPAGNYRLTVDSGIDGVRSLGRNMLDGDGNGLGGDDFVQEFIVEPANGGAVVLDPMVLSGNAAALEILHDQLALGIADAEKTIVSQQFADFLLEQIHATIVQTAGGSHTIAAAVNERLGEALAETLERLGVVPNEYAVVWGRDARFLVHGPSDNPELPDEQRVVIGWDATGHCITDRIPGAVLAVRQASESGGTAPLALAIVPIDLAAELLTATAAEGADGHLATPSVGLQLDWTGLEQSNQAGVLFIDTQGIAGTETFVDLEPSTTAHQLVAPASITGLDPAIKLLDDTVMAELEAVFGNLADLPATLLVQWFDPVDFVLTDAQGRRVGHANGRTFQDHAGSFFSGDATTELLVIADALDDVYYLSLVGLGASYRGVAHFSAATSHTSTSYQGKLDLGASIVAVLDFQLPAAVAASPPLARPGQDLTAQRELLEQHLTSLGSSGQPLGMLALQQTNNDLLSGQKILSMPPMAAAVSVASSEDLLQRNVASASTLTPEMVDHIFEELEDQADPIAIEKLEDDQRLAFLADATSWFQQTLNHLREVLEPTVQRFSRASRELLPGWRDTVADWAAYVQRVFELLETKEAAPPDQRPSERARPGQTDSTGLLRQMPTHPLVLTTAQDSDCVLFREYFGECEDDVLSLAQYNNSQRDQELWWSSTATMMVLVGTVFGASACQRSGFGHHKEHHHASVGKSRDS